MRFCFLHRLTIDHFRNWFQLAAKRSVTSQGNFKVPSVDPIFRTVRGSSPCGAEIFRTRPDRPWSPASLLYNGYRVTFRDVKRPERGLNHPHPFSVEVKEKVELYLCFPSGALWPVKM